MQMFLLVLPPQKCTILYAITLILFTPNPILCSSTDILDATLHFETNTSDDTLHSTADTPDASPLSATNTPCKCYFMADDNLHSGDDTPDAIFYPVLALYMLVFTPTLILPMLCFPSVLTLLMLLFVMTLQMLFSTVHPVCASHLRVSTILKRI
jgi:hypothetical protein